MTHPRLQQLLQGNNLWLGKASLPRENRDSQATGHPALDAALHLGGWPRAGSVELLSEHRGIGELSLLLPALAALSQTGRIAWLNPPFVPYAPALQQQGVHLPACLVVRAAPQQQGWAAEQLLRSGAFAAVLTWSDSLRLADRELRRLQVAAREERCWHSHFRPLACAQQSSPAMLRLLLQATADCLQLEVLKQSGGWSGQRIEIPRDPRLLLQQTAVEQWPLPAQRTPLQRKPITRLRLLQRPVPEPPVAGEHSGVH